MLWLISHLSGNQKIAQDHQLPPVLNLTELGRGEKAVLGDENMVNLVTQDLAVALAMVERGDLAVAIWHTAYALPKLDLGNHCLTEVNILYV